MRRRMRNCLCLIVCGASLMLVLMHLLGPLRPPSPAVYIKRMLAVATTPSPPPPPPPALRCADLTLAASGLTMRGSEVVGQPVPSTGLPAPLRLSHLNARTAPHFPRVLSEFEHGLSLELLGSLTKMLDGR